MPEFGDSEKKSDIFFGSKSYFFFQCVDRHRRRNCIGHFTDSRDPTRARRFHAGRHRLFVRQAGFAEVDVAIDQAGEDEEACCIDNLN